MKTFRQIISEVAQPEPGDEKRFKGKHKLDGQIHDPENYEEDQFTSKKPKATRPADYKYGLDKLAYEGYINVKGQHYEMSDDYDATDDITPGKENLKPDPMVARPIKAGTIINDPLSRQALLRKQSEIQRKIIENVLMSYQNVQEATAWDSNTKTEREVSHWNIVHQKSGKVVGKAATRKGAKSSVDRHDNNYGSYAHVSIPVWKD
jgi:hypothetical protein